MKKHNPKKNPSTLKKTHQELHICVKISITLVCINKMQLKKFMVGE
jgi:hypothetical protein